MSEVISNLLEPVGKTWNGGMEMESTGDMLSIVNEINEQGLELEDVDLEKVDKEIADQEKAVDERYNTFDTDPLLQKEETECNILERPCDINVPDEINNTAKQNMCNTLESPVTEICRTKSIILQSMIW